MNMSLTVYTKTYELADADMREILRYAGVRGGGDPSDGLADILKEVMREVDGRLSFKVCFCELPVSIGDGSVDLGFATVASRTLEKRLDSCDSAIVFAATLGIELDRLIARYSAVAPTKALVLDAIGAERIECLCETFCEDIKAIKRADGADVRPRFSPGYGDLPLELQKNIFTLLDCHKRIGLSLNESMLMSPSKSVTAIIGVCNKEKR